jgi:hypothetical protein
MITPPLAEVPAAATSDAAVEVGPQARALLDSLGDQGASRARSMASDYAQRLVGDGGATP